MLIVYGTTEGQTAKIAHEISGGLRAQGHSVDVYRCGDAPDELAIGACDAVIVGSSIHQGKHHPEVIRWVKKNRDQLDGVHGAFFSVSLSAAGDEEDRAAAQRCIEEFFEDAGWRPALSAQFGGALAYSQYGIAKKIIMRRIAAKKSGDVDASHDYNYTDWQSVHRFADDVVGSIGALS